MITKQKLLSFLLFCLLPFPLVFPVIYQRSGKLPRKAAARNYNCVFPEPSPPPPRGASLFRSTGGTPSLPFDLLVREIASRS